MSLIEEALRRVQDPTVSGQSAPPLAPRKEQKPSKASVPSAHSWLPTPQPATPARTAAAPQTHQALMAVAFTILALTATLITGGAFWMTRAAHKTAGGPAPTTATAPATPAPASTQSPSGPNTTSPIAATLKAVVAPLLPNAPSKKTDELQLTGIVEGIGEPYAVINGGIIAIGEPIGRFTLVAIRNGAATLRRDDGTETIVRVAR